MINRANGNRADVVAKIMIGLKVGCMKLSLVVGVGWRLKMVKSKKNCACHFLKNYLIIVWKNF